MSQKKKLSKLAKLILIGSFLCVFLLVFFLSLKKSEILNSPLPLFYEESGRTNYRVCLKDNNDYPKKCLDPGMTYIASLIDFLDVDFNYNFNIDEEVNTEYSYYISAEVKVFERKDASKIIYEQEVKLVDPQTLSANETKEFNISQNIKLNYDVYNDLVRAFKTNHNVVADSHIVLKLYVETTNSNEKIIKPIRTSNVMSVTIPLTESQIEVALSHKSINNRIEYGLSDKKEVNYAFLALAVVSGLTSAGLLVMFAYVLIKSTSKKTLYEKYIARILRQYDDIVTEAVTLIDEDAYEIYDIKTFEELKNICDRLDKPIIFTEGVLKSEVVRTWFSIIDNDILYRYVVRSDEDRFN